VSRCVEGHRPIAEVSHEPAREAEHVWDPFVLGTAVPDQYRGAGCLGALGAPSDARDGLAIDVKVETLLDDAFLCLLADSVHDPYPPQSERNGGAHGPTQK
jgi:hypothetical protein